MELIPAIDLLDGAVVRLVQGDYDRVTDYGDDPLAVARSWVGQGATRLHIVDLGAARDGTRGQADIITGIVAAARVPCQVAGGIRDAVTVGALLDAGVDRVVLGTAFIRDPGLARVLVDRWGAQRIVAAVDVRDGQAIGEGWTAAAVGAPALELIGRLLSAGVEHFAVTAIVRDGLLTGPDMDLLAQAAAVAGGPSGIIASAGVGSLDDVRSLSAAGYGGAILGRALYEGRIDLAEALTLAG
jgi:phosphoribosylformimino-5-aminoimidazole carboxamide ribotide isomerase